MSNPNIAEAGRATRFGPDNQPFGRRTRAGSRDRLNKEFLDALSEDFSAHGKAAIQAAREQDPMGYSRMVASILPKEHVVTTPEGDMSDEQLTAHYAAIGAELEARAAKQKATH